MLLQIPSSPGETPYLSGGDLEYMIRKDTDLQVLIGKMFENLTALTELVPVDINQEVVGKDGLSSVKRKSLWGQEEDPQTSARDAIGQRERFEILEIVRSIVQKESLSQSQKTKKIYCQEIESILILLKEASQNEPDGVKDAVTDTRRTLLEIIDFLTPHARLIRNNFGKIGIAKRSYDELSITLKKFSSWKGDQIQAFLQGVNSQKEKNALEKVFWILSKLLDKLIELKEQDEQSVHFDQRNASYFFEIMSIFGDSERKKELFDKLNILSEISQIQTTQNVRENYKYLGFVERNIDELFLSIDDYTSWDGGQIFLFLLSLTNVEGEAEQVHQTLKKFLEKGFSFDDHHIQVILEIIQKRIFDDAHKRELIDIAKSLNRI